MDEHQNNVSGGDRLTFILEAEADLADWLAVGALSAQAEDRPAYRTNYIGSKQKLLDFIWEATPQGVSRAVDAFSGSSAVAYMFKGRGFGVTSNDRLRYAFHIARAIVENNDVTLTDEEIGALVKPNSSAGTFVRDTFTGIYFPDGVHGVIDEVRANIEALEGYKKDIALFALGKACIGGKASFGHFGTSVTNERGDTPDEFRARVQDEARRINALVFTGEQPCTASNQDVAEFLPAVEVDLAYFDPPYATEFSQTNYERAYHFIEGLMTYWDGKEIEAGSKLKTYKIESKGITRKTARDFFTRFLGAAKHIPHWLLSYRDKAYPNESEIQELVSAAGKSCTMESRDHAYSISARRGENSMAKEHLFICAPTTAAAARGESVQLKLFAERVFAVWEETDSEIRFRIRDPNHFRKDSFRREDMAGFEGVSMILGKVRPPYVEKGADPDAMFVQALRFDRAVWSLDEAKAWVEKHDGEFTAEAEPASTPDTVAEGTPTAVPLTSAASLKTRASSALLKVDADGITPQSDGDKTFRFVLTHAGTNKNGDHFTPEELKQAASTAIGRKIDLAHSQDFHDIVGAIVGSEYIDDATPRVECVGELYTAESESARLAYKLMKRSVVAHVSMECDYEEGECSVCGKRIKSRAEYCVHLKNSKGADFRGKPVYEILHGVTFTGVGLLDREGADEGAVISNVAQTRANPLNASVQLETKGQTMADENKNKPGETPGSESAQKPPPGTPPAATPGAPDPAEELKRLRDENERLKRELAAAKQQIDALQAEKAAQGRRARAEKLVENWEKKGMKFADAKARDQELERLSALSDDALTASEAVVANLPTPTANAGDDKGQDGDGKTAADGGKPSATAARRKPAPKADAGVKPFAVDDSRTSLEDKLKHGLLAAYKGRNARFNSEAD